MIKKFMQKVTGIAAKAKGKALALAVAAGAGLITVLSHATPSFAANADLDTATTSLTDGAGDMKTDFLTLIGVIIPIIVVVFGIGWLIVIFKKKMSNAK